MKLMVNDREQAPGGPPVGAGTQVEVDRAVASLEGIHRWLDGAAAADGAGLDVTQLARVTEGLGRVDSMLAAARAKAVIVADEVEVATAHGAVSTEAWLAGHWGSTGSAVARECRRARHLAGMPDTLAALTAGRISRDHAATLVDAYEKQRKDHEAAERARVAEQEQAARRRQEAAAAEAARAADAAERARRLAAAEERERAIRQRQADAARRRADAAAAARRTRQDALLDQAATGRSPDQVREAAKAQRAADDGVLARSEAAQRTRRSLRDWIDESTGMGHFAVSLPGEDYERVKAAVEAASTFDPPETPISQRRTPEQRRADGFVDLIDAAMRFVGNLPTSHGTRPQMTVTVSADTLTGHVDRVGRGQFGIWLSADTMRRLACDARLARAVVSASSQVLDLGRQTRTWTAAQHRAAVVAFGGCAFPTADGRACGRPAGWCDLHHVEYWRRGGPTDQANGVLLCRRHHTAVHHDGWRMRYDITTNTVTVTKDRPGDRPTIRHVDFTTTPPGAPAGGPDPPPGHGGGRLPL